MTERISFLPALTLLFIGLKLAGAISWSWWWVLSPLWMPMAGAAAIVALVMAAVGISLAVDSFNGRRA